MHPVDPQAPQGPESPVRTTPKDAGIGPLKNAAGLCLSGGGYRAMLFHLGTLWRLNDAAYLGKLDRISTDRSAQPAFSPSIGPPIEQCPRKIEPDHDSTDLGGEQSAIRDVNDGKY
jgi:hypothetical protein